MNCCAQYKLISTRVCNSQYLRVNLRARISSFPAVQATSQCTSAEKLKLENRPSHKIWGLATTPKAVEERSPKWTGLLSPCLNPGSTPNHT